jgi:hypothetical protein
MDVRNHFAWVAVCAQEMPDQLIHSDRFGTGYLDRIVLWFGECDIRQGRSDVSCRDWLHESGW